MSNITRAVTRMLRDRQRRDNTGPPIDPDDVPATVEYVVPGCARVTHPSGNNLHENALLTRRRLVARGVRVLPP